MGNLTKYAQAHLKLESRDAALAYLAASAPDAIHCVTLVLTALAPTSEESQAAASALLAEGRAVRDATNASIDRLVSRPPRAPTSTLSLRLKAARATARRLVTELECLRNEAASFEAAAELRAVEQFRRRRKRPRPLSAAETQTQVGVDLIRLLGHRLSMGIPFKYPLPAEVNGLLKVIEEFLTHSEQPTADTARLHSISPAQEKAENSYFCLALALAGCRRRAVRITPLMLAAAEVVITGEKYRTATRAAPRVRHWEEVVRRAGKFRPGVDALLD